MTSISIDFRYRFLSINCANISQLHFGTVRIAKLLSNLHVKKAAGRYYIPCWVLKNAALSINCPIPATVFLTFTADWGCPAGLEKSERTCPLQKGRQVICPAGVVRVVFGLIFAGYVPLASS